MTPSGSALRTDARRRAARPVTSPPIHIRCTDTGTWSVHPEDHDEPLSHHASETEAERAARQHAEAHGNGPIVVHDRYARTHVVEGDGRVAGRRSS